VDPAQKTEEYIEIEKGVTMANPTHRHTRARRDKRRASWKLGLTGTMLCPECQEPKLPHKVCMSCGTYNGKKIIEVIEKEAT
jgi:large subunit ribosomal protein L32